MNAEARQRAQSRIDELMERAEGALHETQYFECERLAGEALAAAHRAGLYDAMARILMPLEEARRQKRLAAADAGVIRIVSADPPQDADELEAGCWLVAPPLVGANGRELRDLANEAGVPVILIVREPRTRTGLCPIVMIGPVTVRTRVEEPPAEPDVDWFIDASEALGDEALEQVADDLPAETRVDALYERLLTLQDHDKLHQALAAACHDAAREVAEQS